MKSIKRFLPPAFKQFLWFIFKSPQRKWVGYKTILTDIRGYMCVWFKSKSYERITICIGVKNRSQMLLEHLIASLEKCEFKLLINLSVYDCGSDDVADLGIALSKRFKGLITYEKGDMPFARSIAFNRAVANAETAYILICDADMSLPFDIVEKLSRYVTKRSAWFPKVWYTNEDGSGRYYGESTGMMACLKSSFLKMGGYDESIREWGKEDWLLYFEFYKMGIACIRTKEREFVHHYHPSLKPPDFKPLF